jgi:hypothetical protein
MPALKKKNKREGGEGCAKVREGLKNVFFFFANFAFLLGVLRVYFF